MTVRFRDNRIIYALISCVAVVAILFSVSCVEPQHVGLNVNYPHEADSAVSSVDAKHTIVYAETGRSTLTRETASRKSGSGRADNYRNAFGTFAVASGLCALYVFFLLIFSRKTVPGSHLYIISYIHDLDGMKS